MTHQQPSAGDRLFVLKEIAKNNFHNDGALQEGLPRSDLVRRLEDTNEEYSMIVFPYVKDDLLNLCASQQLSLRSRKRILKDALRGIAALHAEDYVHTGEDADSGMIPTLTWSQISSRTISLLIGTPLIIRTLWSTVFK